MLIALISFYMIRDMAGARRPVYDLKPAAEAIMAESESAESAELASVDPAPIDPAPASTESAAAVVAVAESTQRTFNETRPVAAEVAARNPKQRDADALKSAESAPATVYPVVIRRPEGPPIIELEQPDPLGRVGKLTCSTCHSVRPPNRERRRAEDLKEFHRDMTFAHGELACYACHNPNDSDSLRLADGQRIAYPDVMDLCAQCHGAQAKDYARGLHGGMIGYWDLSRGERVRNNCVDCHDPHAPAFPHMIPTFKPRDRFLHPHEESTGHDVSDEQED
ncbi:MAG: hypothetical protein KDA92_04505 [Planctomycetales bacterium]|nr:hypothetical protein [Planctomycetales bacterium]